MAERRMISLEVVDTDAFLDMPQSSQLLYFHLSVRADDDGFVSNPRKIARTLGANADDMKVLITKKFVIAFDDGVCVIKHWRINNFIRKDIYKETKYLNLKQTLFIRPNGAYTLSDDGNAIPIPKGHFQLDSVNDALTERQLRLDKGSIGKDRIVKSSPEKSGVHEIVNYFFELKGWANQKKEFYAKNDIRYAHHAKRAKELLELCEGNVIEAKECLRKMSEWAKSKDLTWMIETVFKHWYDIDLLKPKEKKPHYDNCRIFQKTEGGKWFIIRGGEIKELGIPLKKEQIAWK